ncbi:flagellar basal body-associated protein FliL [Microvirga tunisiensis]|uniref:Flagellar basal body-associated protein FliL n=2 Tax=Pannonibacter tanglangensis TaxID=2750084 RepID=A0ABW9ZGH8_9HYPH|nr:MULTISPECIES: flagellar basal body-associated FliL family protein [unclassified Pannonibacter]NBN63541.1 flagellar basal body-associated protein FliL [Pannonibacter sp. XCT-34]NBN77178.1 flagellar basal body-associated protein FliL [Pannonibacter sp. XCT-53]
MAAEAEAEGEDGAEGKKGLGKKKLMIIGGGAVAALLLIGGGAYFFLFAGGEEPEVDPNAPPVEEQVPVVFFELPEMTVNLSTTGRATYLRVRIALEVQDQATVDRITPLLPRILDAFQIYLRELRPADLEGSAGLFRLKEELLRRINLSVYPSKVNAVLFKEILIQ